LLSRSNHQIIKSTNPQIIKPSNHQIIKSSNHQTHQIIKHIKPSNHQIIKSSNHQTIKSSNHQTIKRSNHQIIKSTNHQTIPMTFYELFFADVPFQHSESFFLKPPEQEIELSFMRENLQEAVAILSSKSNGFDSSPLSPSLSPAPFSSSTSGTTERRRGAEKKPLPNEDTGFGLSSSSPSSFVDGNGNVFEEEDSDDIKFSYSDTSYQFPKIKAATVDKLVERLTHEVYPGHLPSFLIVVYHFF